MLTENELEELSEKPPNKFAENLQTRSRKTPKLEARLAKCFGLQHECTELPLKEMA